MQTASMSQGAQCLEGLLQSPMKLMEGLPGTSAGAGAAVPPCAAAARVPLRPPLLQVTKPARSSSRSQTTVINAAHSQEPAAGQT